MEQTNQRINMSLDDIILSNGNPKRGGGSRSGAVRGGQASRNSRNTRHLPYSATNSRARKLISGNSATPSNAGDCALKFLLPNSLAGSLIGIG
jgi:hypothetical protein